MISIPSGTHLIVDKVNLKEAVDGGSEHMLPVGEMDSQWEQIAPIPTFHWTQRHGEASVEQLWYLPECNDAFGTNVAGVTLEEAEAKMRKSLPFSIELGRGMLEVAPTAPLIELADKLSQYFRLRPTASESA